MSLTHQLRDESGILTVRDLQNLPHALVDEHILTPLAEVELLHAGLGCLSVEARLILRLESTQCRLTEDFDWAMHAIPAVVQVGLAIVLHQYRTQATREEDGVWIRLDSPRILSPIAIVQDLFPECDEDPTVQSRLRVAPNPAVEVAVDHVGVEPCVGSNLHALVGVDHILVAIEDPDLVVVVPSHKIWLIAERQHEHEAEHSGSLGWILVGGGLLWSHDELLPRRRDASDDTLLRFFVDGLAPFQPALARTAGQLCICHPNE
mmetsp:Transcript_16412/g.39028  ORF Transcript_16412/g.39028 Transcript_16412/m.39028 type:complete len:263 (-) Transcript_16412:403-1191(-)